MPHIYPGGKCMGTTQGNTVFSGVTPHSPTPACCWNHLHPRSSDPKACLFLHTIPVLCLSASHFFLAAQTLAVTQQALTGGCLCAGCCRGRNHHTGDSFQTKECRACSDKGISFCIWLQETVWDTVFGCQDVGIWGIRIFMGIAGLSILNHDFWKVQRENLP